MNIIHQTLQRLEMRLQALIEGSTGRIFPAHPFRHELVQQLVEAMQAETRLSADGSLQAPNLFIIFLPEEQAQVFENQPELLDELEQCLHQASQETQVWFPAEPVVKVVRNPEPGAVEAQIVAQFSLSMDEETSTLDPLAVLPRESPALQAFLIVDGTQIFPLDGRTVCIGHSDTNELVIPHPEISPEHAQLRLVRGQYKIFDLNSAGGTFVNGEKVTETTLSPGDVISLAGIPLVFGCDQNADLERTQELS
jgi:hypothetical protein